IARRHFCPSGSAARVMSWPLRPSPQGELAMFAIAYPQPTVLPLNALRSLGARLLGAFFSGRSKPIAPGETEFDAVIAAARSAFGPLEIRLERGHIRYAGAPGADALLGEM